MPNIHDTNILLKNICTQKIVIYKTVLHQNSKDKMMHIAKAPLLHDACLLLQSSDFIHILHVHHEANP